MEALNVTVAGVAGGGVFMIGVEGYTGNTAVTIDVGDYMGRSAVSKRTTEIITVGENWIGFEVVDRRSSVNKRKKVGAGTAFFIQIRKSGKWLWPLSLLLFNADRWSVALV